ncbi:MAG: hypothetical protein V9E98_10715 [Candidatus Nanopelagicales bacterium]
MCGCFVFALGAFFPRVAILLLWLFTDYVQAAFKGEWILPLLGVILLPYTTLSYILLYWWLGGVTGFAWFLVALAFLCDLGAWAGGARSGTSYRTAS